MKFLIIALLAIFSFAACGSSNYNNPQVAHNPCAPGQPTHVQPMQSYIAVTCDNGTVAAMQVADINQAGFGSYNSGQGVMNDPFFWMYMMGPSYRSYPVYSGYIHSPTYVSYHYYHPIAPRSYSSFTRTYRTGSGYSSVTRSYSGYSGYRSSGYSYHRSSYGGGYHSSFRSGRR
jgi:hypothetical protein